MDPQASTGERNGEKRGHTVVVAAVLGGIALAIGGAYLILSSSGLGPSAGNAGPASTQPLVVSDAGRIDISGANRSCTKNVDCAMVDLEPCNICACAKQAVAASEQARHAAAVASIDCAALPKAPTTDACAACPAVELGCLDGVCTSM